MSARKGLQISSWIVLGFCLLIGSPTYVYPEGEGSLTAISIREAIAARKARWVARDNPISSLSIQDKLALLGAREPSFKIAPPAELYAPTAGVLPIAFDWRNVNGQSYVTPVRNQGECGACFRIPTCGRQSKRNDRDDR
jgi:hypothetical protein